MNLGFFVWGCRKLVAALPAVLGCDVTILHTNRQTILVWPTEHTLPKTIPGFSDCGLPLFVDQGYATFEVLALDPSAIMSSYSQAFNTQVEAHAAHAQGEPSMCAVPTFSNFL